MRPVCATLLFAFTLLLATTSFAQQLTYNRTDYPSAALPISIVTADFNDDGKPDIAVANGHANTVSVYLATTSGHYGSAVTYAVSNPAKLIANDFNHDGFIDLLVSPGVGTGTSAPAANEFVLLNAGNGTFPTLKTTILNTAPDDVAVGDFNGDNIPDIAVTPFDGSHAVSLYYGTGTGTFTFQHTLATATSPDQIFVVDLNKDGRLDVLVDIAGPALVSFLRNSDGSWSGAHTTSIASTGYEWMTVADFNGDRAPDVGFNHCDGRDSCDNNVTIFRNNLNGTFTDTGIVNVGFGEGFITGADVNGDG